MENIFRSVYLPLSINRLRRVIEQNKLTNGKTKLLELGCFDDWIWYLENYGQILEKMEM